MKSTTAFIILFCLNVSACTNQELYETLQDEQLTTCKQKAKTHEQYTQCQAMYGTSYDKYKKTTQ